MRKRMLAIVVAVIVTGCSENEAVQSQSARDAGTPSRRESHSPVFVPRALSPSHGASGTQQYMAASATATDCRPSTPSLGMFCLQAEQSKLFLRWKRGEVQGEPFYWTMGETSDGRLITLVAAGVRDGNGPVNAPMDNYPEWEEDESVVLSVCRDEENLVETVDLRSGFLYVITEEKPRARESTVFVRWRLIVRTRSIPAGAYSTRFVLLRTNDSRDEPVREGVLRPHQSDDCENPKEPQDGAKHIVLAQPGDGSSIDVLDRVSYCEAVKGHPTMAILNIETGSDEAKFLQEACRFIKEAIKADKPDDANLECLPSESD